MFYVAQLLVAAYACTIARKESTYIKALRQYVPINNPYNQPFHMYGWFGIVILGVAVLLLQQSLAALLLTPFLSIPIYWAVYDATIGQRAFGDWRFIGSSAGTDQWLKKRFGARAGASKMAICAAVVVLLNLLYLFL